MGKVKNKYNLSPEDLVKEKELSFLKKQAKLQFGYNSMQYVKLKDAIYYLRHRNKKKKKSQEFRRKNPNYLRLWYEKNEGWHEKRYAADPSIKKFSVAKRRAKKMQATPIWSETEKIRALYQKVNWLESLTGLKYHVDHVVPLNSEKVCGLHVWANLQILEVGVNLSKSNKVGGL